MTGHVIHLSMEIDADQDTVWSVLTDLSHTADILRSVQSADRISDGPYDVGTSWHERRSMFGHKGDEELRVTESDPPRRTIHETQLGHDRIRTAYSLQPMPASGTKLLLTASVDMGERNAAETLMWNIWGEFSFESTRKMLRHDLEDIKGEAERRAGDRTAADAG